MFDGQLEKGREHRPGPESQNVADGDPDQVHRHVVHARVPDDPDGAGTQQWPQGSVPQHLQSGFGVDREQQQGAEPEGRQSNQELA